MITVRAVVVYLVISAFLPNFAHSKFENDGDTTLAVRIGSCALWGRKPNLKAGERSNEVKLDQWTPGSLAAGRTVLDLVCEIENVGAWPSDFLVLTFADFIVAPTSQYGLDSLEGMKETGGWGEQSGFDDVKLTQIKWLRPGEKRRITVGAFDLRALLEHYDGESDTLWPWWMRVNVRVESRRGDRIASTSAMLSLIPSEKRLRERVSVPVERHEPIQPISSTHREGIFMEPACFQPFCVARDASGKLVVLTTKELDQMATERKMPTFPPMSARITGSLRMRVLIDETGRIRCAERVQGHPILVLRVTETLEAWRFRPYISSGRPTPVLGFLDYRFEGSDPRLVFLDFDLESRQSGAPGDKHR